MNSSRELGGLHAGVSRYEEKMAMDERLEMLKQEILDRIKPETRDIVKQGTTEVRKEIMPYLKLIETMENDIHEMKNSMINRDEMEDEMNKFFENFVNEFSHAIESIKDPKVKNIFKETFAALCRG